MIKEDFAATPNAVVVLDEPPGLSEIGTGILFIYASWSATAVGTLARWTDIARRFPGEDRWLYVLDADVTNSRWALKTLGHVVSGNGETYWIFAGEIVDRIQAYSHRSEVAVEPTRTLLERRKRQDPDRG